MPQVTEGEDAMMSEASRRAEIMHLIADTPKAGKAEPWPDVADAILRYIDAHTADLTARLASAHKALREIGERAICDWQDELVGFVSVGLGTADWDSVVTMEQVLVRQLRDERDTLKRELEALKAK